MINEGTGRNGRKAGERRDDHDGGDARSKALPVKRVIFYG